MNSKIFKVFSLFYRNKSKQKKYPVISKIIDNIDNKNKISLNKQDGEFFFNYDNDDD